VDVVVGRPITGMFGGGLFLIGLSYLDCTQTALAVVMLVLAVSMTGFVYSGYFVNHMDIAPQYAGTLMGISNGLAAISGFIAPYVAARVTESVSRLNWILESGGGLADLRSGAEPLVGVRGGMKHTENTGGWMVLCI